MLNLQCIGCVNRLIVHRVQLDLIVIQEDYRSFCVRRRSNLLLRMDAYSACRSEQRSPSYASAICAARPLNQHEVILAER